MDIDIVNLITLIFGEYAAYILVTLSMVGYGWTLIRQFIPARMMSKLPECVLSILEFTAGNKWESENSLNNDPKHHKRVTSNKL